jgi:uncharacterized membrane protein HdeD (DUF308 family)
VSGTVRQHKHSLGSTTKRIIVGLLFLLGLFEIVLPAMAAARNYSFDPLLAKAFDLSNATDEQLQVYQSFRHAMAPEWRLVMYCGITTMVLALLLVLSGRKRKDDA